MHSRDSLKGSAVFARTLIPRMLVKRSPILYRPLNRIRNAVRRSGNLPRLASDDVEICVEGYPSSANSFAVNVLRAARPGLRISSHHHAIANIKIAIRLGIPCVALIRPPEDAIASRVSRFGTSPRVAISEYCDMHEFLSQRRANMLIASFRTVTEDTDRFLDLVSAYAPDVLGPDFARPEPEGIREDMEAWFVDNELEIGLPSGQRKTRIAQARQELESHALWQRAKRSYDAVLPWADALPDPTPTRRR